MKRKILVLGGAGFIGFHLCKFLFEQGIEDVTIADNFYNDQYDDEFKAFLKKSNYKLVQKDFTIKSSFGELDDQYDQLYMLASVVGVSETLTIPHEIIRINSELILNTLEWLIKATVGKVVFTSTSECYAGTTDVFNYQIPTSEKVPLCIEDITHPRWTYAVTKMLGESGFYHYAKKYGFDITLIRYNNVIGPRMGFRHVVPNVIERFMKNEDPFKVYGSPQTRSFCDIADAIKGTYLCMEKKKGNGEIFHIGNEEEITIGKLVSTVGELMGYKGTYEEAPTFPASVNRRCPDISKSKELLGFQPQIKWQDAIPPMINWYSNYFENQGFKT